jgi:hypothetical protein
MVEEKVRRRVGFQSGRWVRMGDQRPWMFPPPPAPGIDHDYDALSRVHRESEDADDERRIELAMAILLLSRNYDPTPEEYQAIFSFGTDQAARSTAQAAISEAVRRDLEPDRSNRLPEPARATAPIFHTHFRAIRSTVRSCAGRLRSTMAPRGSQTGGRG